MDNPFDFFKKIFYINLESRIDRKIDIEEQFSLYGIKAERFRAITLTEQENLSLVKDGCNAYHDDRPKYARFTKSCTLSHINVILRAKIMGYENVLVFEDDVVFHTGILKELNHALNDLKKFDWNMFYIGTNPLAYKKETEYIGKSLGSLTTHAYAVNHTFYDTLLNINFKAFPFFDGYVASLSEESQDNKIYMCLKNLAWQRKSFSNLEDRVVDYKPSIDGRYNSNMKL
jgi:GR25 family glycosyltransferase involved in LPS biosynthesis